MTTIEERTAEIMGGGGLFTLQSLGGKWVSIGDYEALARRVAELEADVDKWSRDATEIANYAAIRLEAAERMCVAFEIMEKHGSLGNFQKAAITAYREASK